MKRILALLFCLLLLGVLTASFTAEAVCVRTDKALSEKENAYLQSLHDTIRKAYGIEAFLVFNYDYTAGEAFRTYARAFLDEHAVTEDAVVFAVSADNYYMNTRGKAGELLRDDDLDLLYDAMAEADENGEQYKAAVQFYTTMNALLSHRVGSSDPAEPASGAEETELTAARVQLPGSVPIPDEISPTRGDRLVSDTRRPAGRPGRSAFRCAGRRAAAEARRDERASAVRRRDRDVRAYRHAHADGICRRLF